MSREVTAQQLKERFRPDNKNPLPQKSGSYNCNQKVVFNGTEFDSNESQLLEFDFMGGLEFIGCTFNNGLFFGQLKVKGGLKFFKCETPQLEQVKPGLRFQEFEIDSLEIENCNFAHGISFEKPSNRPSNKQRKNVINTFSIKNGVFRDGEINIVRTEIKSGFHFKHVKACTKLIIKDCQIGKISDIDNFRANEITIGGKDLVFKDNLSLWKIRDVKRLSITSGIFERNIRVINPNVSDRIDLQKLNVIGGFNIEAIDPNDTDPVQYKFPKVFLKACTFNEGFSINGAENECEKLEVYFSPMLKGKMTFSDTDFKEVYFTGTNSESNIYFNKCGFAKVHIEDFLNTRILSINNSNSEYIKQLDSEFKISDSNLGNWVLSNFDFAAFTKVIWRDSLVSDLKTSSVNWFEDKSLVIEKENNPKTCFRRRELYKQLKHACEKEGDRISALEFKSRELRAYSKSLQVIGKKRWSVDRITLCLGLSNNHGQNWIKPFLWILVITTFIFYPLIFMAADPDISYWCLECDFISLKTFVKKLWDYGFIWPSLFNPARRLGDLFPGVDISFALGFWDGFQRIVLAFFIFQIISAFRKFVK